MNKKIWVTMMLGMLIETSQVAVAGEMGAHSVGLDVYVPELTASNEFSAAALFLRPGGSNDYAVLTSPFNPNVADPILTPNWESKGINPDFSSGFNLNFRRNFSSTGNDINIQWARLRTSDSATFPVNRNPTPYTQMTGPNWNIGPDSGATSSATGQVKYNYDVLNGEIAKHVNFDPNLYTRFFTGISGVWLQQKTIANFIGTDPVLGLYTFGITTQSKYSGAGLRLGMEGEYNGFYNINPVALLAGNIFIGSLQPSTNTVSTGGTTSANGIPVNYQSVSHKSYVQVVPALDAKLGLKYSQLFSNDKLLTVEGGYMASIYLNAVQNYVPSTTVPSSQGIITGSMYLQSLFKTTESFSVDGPYIQASLKM